MMNYEKRLLHFLLKIVFALWQPVLIMFQDQPTYRSKDLTIYILEGEA